MIGFFYGVISMPKRETPKYFQLYVCAAGCYMLEELWVTVNSLFGNGAQDGLVTVRLFGFFGCLLFMLSANANEFDMVVDDGRNKKARAFALAAPAVLLAIFAATVFSVTDTVATLSVINGFISLSPALWASYLSLKHLLIAEDSMGFLNLTRWIDIFSLVFYVGNFVYPMANIYCSKLFMGVFDLILTAVLFAVIIMCRRGAEKWKTLI